MSFLNPGPVDLRTAVCELTGKDIGKDFNMFETRLVFQKAMYLLGAARAVRPSFTFGLYLYGPYSSSWAKRGFEVSSGAKCPIELLPSISKVQSLVRGKTANELVTYAALHYYHRTLNLSKQASRQKAVEDNKLTVLQYFDPAWSDLEKVHWLT